MTGTLVPTPPPGGPTHVRAGRPPNSVWFLVAGALVVVGFVGTVFAVTMFVVPLPCGGVGFRSGPSPVAGPPPPDFAISDFVAGGAPGNHTDVANVTLVRTALHWGEVGIVLSLTGARGTPTSPPPGWLVSVTPSGPSGPSHVATFDPRLQNWTEGAGTTMAAGQVVTLETRSVNLTGTGATVDFHEGEGCGGFTFIVAVP